MQKLLRPHGLLQKTIVLLLIASILLQIHGIPPIIHQARAATITLWGDFGLGGWGFTSSSITDPGPTLTTTPGGTVSLSLFSHDPPTPHQFCVDYEQTPDFLCQTPTEPQSAQFSSSVTPRSFTFTASTTPGNYTYFCVIHGSGMVGSFVVRAPHDVAATGVTIDRGFAYNSVSIVSPIHVAVTAKNPGNSTETFFVYAKAGATLIGNVSVTLPAGGTKVVTFNWTSTSGLTQGSYIVTGNATKVSGEAYFVNNQVTGPTFLQKIKGDVSGDCKVDIVDLATVGSTFGKTQGTPGFNPNADLNNDATINIVDLVIVASSFGQVC